MVSDDTYANLDESIKYDEPKFKVFYQKGRATVSPASISQHQKNQLTTAECYSNVPNQSFLVLNERMNESHHGDVYSSPKQSQKVSAVSS